MTSSGKWLKKYMRRPGKSKSNIVDSLDPDCSSQAAAVIRAGGIVAFPTETSYGLAVDPLNPDALGRLFQAKQRPDTKPVLVLVDAMANLTRLVSHIPPRFNNLIDTFWPGPLTLIFPARYGLPDLLTGRSGTIGVRMSSNHVAQSISAKAGGAITATSANISGDAPALAIDELDESLCSQVDLIVDGGRSASTSCSTIVTESGGQLTLVRRGCIDFSDILQRG
jgi:L-threonylcarbamoyladenylate synthase